MPRDGLGELERSVLLAVLHLRGQAYSVSIGGDMRDRLGKNVSLGAIYATLDRLETKRYISSRLGEATAQRGGKPKRLYQIDALGQRALARAQAADALAWGYGVGGAVL